MLEVQQIVQSICTYTVGLETRRKTFPPVRDCLYFIIPSFTAIFDTCVLSCLSVFWVFLRFDLP